MQAINEQEQQASLEASISAWVDGEADIRAEDLDTPYGRRVWDTYHMIRAAEAKNWLSSPATSFMRGLAVPSMKSLISSRHVSTVRVAMPAQACPAWPLRQPLRRWLGWRFPYFFGSNDAAVGPTRDGDHRIRRALRLCRCPSRYHRNRPTAPSFISGRGRPMTAALVACMAASREAAERFVLIALMVLGVASYPIDVQAEEADPGLAQLQKMQEAARGLDYAGVYTYQQGSTILSTRVVHVVDGTGERERIALLDGRPREYIRQ